jgi:3'-phosphoadenosine 5'-phosphosulfate sulfotransferase (PAPS reductase)/FAD synthetase
MKRIVGFSGGIDSQAVSLWVRRRFPAEEVILLNADAGGNENPLTGAFVEEYSRTVFPVHVVSPVVADFLERYGTPGTRHHDDAAKYPPEAPLTFQLLATLKGQSPVSGIRFCTEFLKAAPQRRWMRENLPQGEAFERYSGVRRDESPKRASTPERQWDDYFDCELICPLVDWNKQQCFELVLGAGEAVNPLYRLGAKRVGCSTCVASGKEEIREWAARFPEEVEKKRRWEAETGLCYFRFKVPGKPKASLDEVIAWSKTERGGKVLSLPFVEAEAEAETCSSKYGLCE